MKCVNCGAELESGDVFCKVCGSKVQENTQNAEMHAYRDSNQNERPNYSQNPRQNYGRNSGGADFIKIFALIALMVAVVLLIVLVVNNVLKKDDKEESGDVIGTSANASVNQNTVAKGQSNTTLQTTNTIGGGTSIPSVPTSSKATYTVYYNGVKFSIPDNLIYEKDYINDCVMITDEAASYLYCVTPMEGSFAELKNNITSLSTLLTSQAEFTGTCSMANLETINGVECILLNVSIDGVNQIWGYARLNSMNMVYFLVQNEDNDFSRDYLDELMAIIDSAEYTGDSTYIKSEDGNNMAMIGDILKKSLEKAQ